MGMIDSLKKDNNNDSGIIFHYIIHYLLTNTPKSLWFEKVCSALEVMNFIGLARTVKSTYMEISRAGILANF